MSMKLVALVVLAPLVACEVSAVVGQVRQAAGGGDATSEAGTQDAAGDSMVRDSAPPVGCGLVPTEGCCSRQTLWWCEGGTLKELDCSSKPKCGWNMSGFYDCNTSGTSDPTGTLSLTCAGLFPDGGGPADSGVDGSPGPCGSIPLEGCCDGTTLKYCDEGQLRQVSCAINPSCGWFPLGQYYDCGTDGLEDPTGTYPQVCPGSTPTDGVPDLFPSPEGSVGDATADGGDGVTGGNCDCAVGAPPSGGAGSLLLLLALLFVAARRRG